MAKKKAQKLPTAAAPVMRCFIACDAVSRDPSGGKTSLYGLFDVIWGQAPGYIKPFALFVQLQGKPGKHHFTLDAFGPDGKRLLEPPHEFDLTISPSGTADIIIQVSPLKVSRYGKLTFHLVHNRKNIGWPRALDLKKRSKDAG